MRRTVLPDNVSYTTVPLFGPDAASKGLARALAAVIGTFSPASRGRGGDGRPFTFTGISGYGVNRFAGKLPYALQGFSSSIRPIRKPVSQRLGLNAGVTGQPGLPSTGTAMLQVPGQGMGF